MKVVCWNLRGGGKPATWATLEEMNADVALLQEASAPGSVAAAFDVFEENPVRKNGATRQRWATAILVRRSSGLVARRRAFESSERPWLGELLEESGCCVAIDLQIGEATWLIVDVYSPAWALPSVQRLSEAQLQQIRLRTHQGHDVWVADLLWAWLRTVPTCPMLIGGDFNSSLAFDREFGGRSSGNAVQQQRFRELGLSELVRRIDPDFRKTPTFRHAKGKEHQLDYLYVSSAHEQTVQSVQLGETTVWATRISDHLPIIATL